MGRTTSQPHDPSSAAGSLEVLAELGVRLEKVRREADLRAVELIDMVESADWSGREALVELQARYFSVAKRPESEEQVMLWEAISQHFANLASAYLFLVQVFQTYGRGWAAVGDLLPMVIARALRSNTERLKWLRMRYRAIDPEVWKTLSQLWSYVEDKGMIRARVLVYDDQSTLQREFARPLMLAMSAAESLPPLELDIADRLIAHVGGRFEVQRYAGPGCYFMIDIDQWTAPERYIPGSPVRPGTRFFGPGEAVADIESLSAQLAENQIPASDIGLEGVVDVELIIDVLAHLERHWGLRRPERRGQRRSEASKMSVVLGYANVVDRIERNDTSVPPEGDGTETWNVENESETGYGAIVPVARGDALRVGEPIAVRPMGSRMWAVGAIRRLANQDGDLCYVGIELLARGVQAVSLSREKDGKKIETGLLLPSHIGDSVGKGEINLLLPQGSFSPDVCLDMNVYGNNYLLEPLMVLDNGESFEVGRYRISERSQLINSQDPV